MKNASQLLLAVVLVLMAAPAIAHPGGVDRSGGHTDRSTGEYHYHHGYPAHQHDDGVCPYDFDDKTGEGSGSSGGSGYSYSTVSVESYWRNRYYEENEEKIALQTELKKAEENRMRNFLVPMGVGLAVGLASLILQAVRHAKKMERELLQERTRLNKQLQMAVDQNHRLSQTIRENERKYAALKPEIERMVRDELKKQLEAPPENTDVGVIDDDDSNHIYHKLPSPCIEALGKAFARMDVLEAISRGKKPCIFCKPMGIMDAKMYERRMYRQKAERDEASQWIRSEREAIKRKAVEQMQFKEFKQQYIESAIKATDPLDMSLGAVYISRTVSDNYYHHSEHCQSLESPILVSKIGIAALLLNPCPTCTEKEAPTYDLPVSMPSNGKCYHSTWSLCVFTGKSIPLSEAKKRGLRPCTRCNPPAENPKVWF